MEAAHINVFMMRFRRKKKSKEKKVTSPVAENGAVSCIDTVTDSRSDVKGDCKGRIHECFAFEYRLFCLLRWVSLPVVVLRANDGSA